MIAMESEAHFPHDQRNRSRQVSITSVIIIDVIKIEFSSIEACLRGRLFPLVERQPEIEKNSDDFFYCFLAASGIVCS